MRWKTKHKADEAALHDLWEIRQKGTQKWKAFRDPLPFTFLLASVRTHSAMRATPICIINYFEVLNIRLEKENGGNKSVAFSTFSSCRLYVWQEDKV